MERFVKMPYTFTHKEYADMVYVYGYCNGSANAAVDEYWRRYPLRRTPNRAVFTNVFHALRECGTLPSVHVSSERRSIQLRNRKKLSGSDIYDIHPNDGLLDDMTELLTAKIPEDRLTSSSDESYIYSDVELNGDDNSEPLVKPSEIKTNDRLHHVKRGRRRRVRN